LPNHKTSDMEFYSSHPVLKKLVDGDRIKPIHHHNAKGFGWHINKNATATPTFSFVGTIPFNGIWNTPDEALQAAFAWLAENREHAVDINSLIFADFINYIQD
jgi:hypothetical protein